LNLQEARIVSANNTTIHPLVESIQLLTRWLDRDDDLPGWVPIEMLLGTGTSVPYRSESDLAAIREESRWLASCHPFAISGGENRISYVVGSGHTYKVRARPGANVDEATLDAIRAEILDFTERNIWFDRQQECRRRLDRDGEVFLRFFEQDGRLVVRFIEPEHVAEPPGRTDCPFGIETDPQDVETVRAYHVRRGDDAMTTYERLDASAIQHRKANVDRNQPRGVPLWYSVRHNLRRSWKLLRNMSTVASIQAAIAIVRKHTGAHSGSVQQYVAAMATAQRTDAEGNQKTYQQYPAGAIVDLPPGVDYDFPAVGIDVQKFVGALQAELRAVAARLSMPEFMLSADASNANYASTMVAEGPAVKMFERLQAETIWYDYQVLRRALETAERAGRLPEGVSALVEIDAEAPAVQSRNRLAEAQADQILLATGVVSPQSVAARHGYDWYQEVDLMDRAAERDGGGLRVRNPEPEL
jgi:capsid protein